LYLAITSADLV